MRILTGTVLRSFKLLQAYGLAARLFGGLLLQRRLRTGLKAELGAFYPLLLLRPMESDKCAAAHAQNHRNTLAPAMPTPEPLLWSPQASAKPTPVVLCGIHRGARGDRGARISSTLPTRSSCVSVHTEECMLWLRLPHHRSGCPCVG